MTKNGDDLSIFGLAHWYTLLDCLYQTRGVNCAYAAAKVLHIILDMTATINIESVPESERERLDELRQHINHVNTLLARPAAHLEDIFEGCYEAFDQWRDLLELVDPPRASALTALAVLEDDHCCLNPQTTYSSC